MDKHCLAGVVAVLTFVSSQSGGETHEPKVKGAKPVFVTPGNLRWAEAPPSLPPGAKVALLEGDPAKPGPFVMRVRMPDAYRVAPHTHPKPERVTVISGTFHLGMGATFDKGKGRVMPAGSYGSWPAGMQHYAWVEGETVIQLHGVGPWSITYVNPADDPRKARTRAPGSDKGTP
jgi:hypothetical protein